MMSAVPTGMCGKGISGRREEGRHYLQHRRGSRRAKTTSLGCVKESNVRVEERSTVQYHLFGRG